ncbi:MAG: 2-methylcitrate dehydratase, partial [Planctomycetia bacterium]
DPNKRSIANALTLHFTDGTASDRVEVEYPIGHRRRRTEGVPLLVAKAEENLATRLSLRRRAEIMTLFTNAARLDETPAPEFMDLFVA